MHYMTLHINYTLTRIEVFGTTAGQLTAAPIVAGPVPQRLPAVQAALHDDPFQRIVLTGGAIKRGQQVSQKRLSKLRLDS